MSHLNYPVNNNKLICNTLTALTPYVTSGRSCYVKRHTGFSSKLWSLNSVKSFPDKDSASYYHCCHFESMSFIVEKLARLTLVNKNSITMVLSENNGTLGEKCINLFVK